MPNVESADARLFAVDIPGYHIIRELGRGGMARVYLTQQESLDRHVALKVMSPTLTADKSFTERFLKEGRIVARLNHPNIVTVYDFGTYEGKYYLAMEYLPGGTLDDRIKQGVSLADALGIVKAIGGALGYAHREGIIHRDIKPLNILFRHDGMPVLSDFGIARDVDSKTQLTAPGLMVGSPGYMSPERIRGQPFDGRSDLYSLGVVFYKMLTGNMPYSARDPFAIALLHTTAPIPELPRHLSKFQPIVEKLLAKDPQERFQTGEEFVAVLTEVQRQQQAEDSEATEIASSVSRPQAEGRSQVSVQAPAAGASVQSGVELRTVQLEFRSRRNRQSLAVDLSPDATCLLGKAGTVKLQGEGVLPRHARLHMTEAGLLIEPIEQAPMALNGEPLAQATLLNDGDWLALGASLFQIRFAGSPATGAHPATGVRSPAVRPEPAVASPPNRPSGQPIIIGRLPECDLAIDSPLVSRHHARLICEHGEVAVEDLNSTNGTFVNGRQIVGRTVLHPGDRVEIASFAFIFTGETLEPIDAAGRVRVEVRNLYKEVRDRASRQSKRLLDQIDLVIEPGEFVAIFGTSGSGKSTLLDALNGRRPASGGRVLYNGADLYTSFDRFRAAIGYVPQQDIVHRKISVQKALRYTARLRLPPDTSDQEIDAHIERVLDRVGLPDKAASPIDTPAPLSGGQLKRVSLAVELVANPNILFLDEVTSGLDAGTDKKMMQLFAELAADQKTVICVTHTLENIDACHLVVLLHQGRLVYFGPPGEASRYFGVARLSDVYELLESAPAAHWAEKFLNSSYYKTYVADRLATPVEAVESPASSKSAPIKRRWFNGSQALTLMRRYVDLLLADRRNLAILLLQAPLIAALVGLVFDTGGDLQARVLAENQIGFILVLSAIWCGCLNSTREVVKELPIYLRERAVNLGIGPYLFSKLTPLAVLCLLQCLALLAVVSAFVSWPGDFPARLGTLFLAGMAATTMGLAVSTFVDSNDKAAALIPILLIPQVVLSDFLVPLGDVSAAVARSSIISFSAFDAMKATLDKELAPLAPLRQAFWSNTSMVIILGAGFLLIAFLGLKLKDRRR